MNELIIQLIVLVAVIGLAWAIGTLTERRHLAQLAQRESENGLFYMSQIKTFPGVVASNSAPRLIVAEAVVATDYFKTFIASIQRLFGGEIACYQILLERARREATQRLVEQASQLGYNAICNLRLQTADMGNATSGKGATVVAILASATAYHCQSSSG